MRRTEQMGVYQFVGLVCVDGIGDVVTRDYSKWMTADDVINNVKTYTRNGSIITFHDSLKSIEKLRLALPESIKWLKEQGYEFKIFESEEE